MSQKEGQVDSGESKGRHKDLARASKETSDGLEAGQ
jgi:hypothetical protein